MCSSFDDILFLMQMTEILYLFDVLNTDKSFSIAFYLSSCKHIHCKPKKKKKKTITVLHTGEEMLSAWFG